MAPSQSSSCHSSLAHKALASSCRSRGSRPSRDGRNIPDGSSRGNRTRVGQPNHLRPLARPRCPRQGRHQRLSIQKSDSSAQSNRLFIGAFLSTSIRWSATTSCGVSGAKPWIGYRREKRRSADATPSRRQSHSSNFTHNATTSEPVSRSDMPQLVSTLRRRASSRRFHVAKNPRNGLTHFTRRRASPRTISSLDCSRTPREPAGTLIVFPLRTIVVPWALRSSNRR